jgi:hypothetical protein
MQQSSSVAHSQSPALHRLLRATEQPSSAGSAQVLPASSPKPASSFEPLQLPKQQSLLSLHESLTPPQQVMGSKVPHTAPFAPASTPTLTPVESLLQGSPVAAIESKARAKHGTRRFIALQA